MKLNTTFLLSLLFCSSCKKEPANRTDYCALLECGKVSGYLPDCIVGYSYPHIYSDLKTIKICHEAAYVRSDTENYNLIVGRYIIMDFPENIFLNDSQFLMVGIHPNLEKFKGAYFSSFDPLPPVEDLIDGEWVVSRYSRPYSILPETLEFDKPVDISFHYNLNNINDAFDNIVFPPEAFKVLKINPETMNVTEVIDDVTIVPTETGIYGKGYVKARINSGGHYIAAFPVIAKNGAKGGEVHLLTSGYRNLDKIYSNGNKGGIYLVEPLKKPHTVIQIDYSGTSDFNGKAYITFEGNKPGTYAIDSTNFAHFFYKEGGIMKNVKTISGEIVIDKYDVVNSNIKGRLTSTNLGGITEDQNALNIEADFNVFHVNPW